MFRRLSIAFAASAATLLSAGVVLAQSAPAPSTEPSAASQKGGQMAACRADMKSLCGDVAKGKGNRMKCLVENRAKASADRLLVLHRGRLVADGPPAEQGRTGPGRRQPLHPPRPGPLPRQPALRRHQGMELGPARHG